MNPLLFMPSPRDIPEVKQAWSKLNFDKLIVKYKPQAEAYKEGKDFFVQHEEYTHFVICADDLVIEPWDLWLLLEGSKKYDVIDGLCPIDESQPHTYAIQPLGCHIAGLKPDCSYGAWYMRDKKPILPKDRFLEVGHSGAACRIINRETFLKISFEGGSPDKSGWFDFGMTKEFKELGIPIIIDTSVYMKHLRTAQKPTNEFGYTIWQQR